MYQTANTGQTSTLADNRSTGFAITIANRCKHLPAQSTATIQLPGLTVAFALFRVLVAWPLQNARHPFTRLPNSKCPRQCCRSLPLHYALSATPCTPLPCAGAGRARRDLLVARAAFCRHSLRVLPVAAGRSSAEHSVSLHPHVSLIFVALPLLENSLRAPLVTTIAGAIICVTVTASHLANEALDVEESALKCRTAVLSFLVPLAI
jgi:hypothetical protein